MYMHIFTEYPIIEIWIIIWAVITLIVFFITRHITKTLTDILSPRSRKANPQKPSVRLEEEDRIVDKREKMNFFYTLFVNFTSMLPLWGMLGTVISLIALSGNMTEDEIPIDQFFTALQTTALGIISAIICKSLDAFVAVKVSANNKEADILLQRNNTVIRKKEGLKEGLKNEPERNHS